MKKVFVILLAGTVLYACGSNEGEKKADDPAPSEKTEASGSNDAAATESYEKGLELIGSSDCMACHTIDRKLVGPSYKEVANKYENNEATIDTLVEKIKKGGMGNWGSIMMTPHPDLADADAKEMVKYILSLKDK